MQVVVANEPPVYREVISAAVRERRPRVEVLVAEPADLDRRFSLLKPNLAVCSRVTELVEREVPAWVEMYRAALRASWSRWATKERRSRHVLREAARHRGRGRTPAAFLTDGASPPRAFPEVPTIVGRSTPSAKLSASPLLVRRRSFISWM